MIVIEKENVTITKMAREETGVVSPAMQCVLNPITNKGYSIQDAMEIKSLMDNWGYSLEDAIKTHEDNLAWV